jgi:phosphatidylinositol kinase/protein kinase (PI-3  family)
VISDSTTLYELQKETIQNYVNKYNPNKTVSELRNYFLLSCASNCVLGYILGIGDRNLHNILILKDASLAHIDFSYILGTDPKFIESTEMKLTSDMLNMLGGIESIHYKEFEILYRSFNIPQKIYIFLVLYV